MSRRLAVPPPAYGMFLDSDFLDSNGATRVSD
jgi:hypothetical protein